jgi:hypothetical protein
MASGRRFPTLAGLALLPGEAHRTILLFANLYAAFRLQEMIGKLPEF